MPSVSCIVNTGLLTTLGGLPRWADSLSGVYFDGAIHVVGRAVNGLLGSKLHQRFNTNGQSLSLFDGPFTGTNEANLSLIKSGKLVCVGGTTSFEIWEFNPLVAGNAAGSWSQITADFSASIGQRKMAFSWDLNGWFYIGGGWGRDTLYKTQDFLNWTLVGNLPANILKLSACAYFVHKGKGYCIGGSDNMLTEDSTGFYNGNKSGYVYRFDPAGETWTLVTTDPTNFGTVWVDGVSDGTNIYVNGGLDVASGLNVRKLLYSTDDGATWNSISPVDGLEVFSERHRCAMVNVGGIIYMIAGYGSNDMWKINP